MQKSDLIALIMGILTLKNRDESDDPEDLARRAEDLVDAAEARAAETLADRAAMARSLQYLHEDDEKTPEPVEIDVHGRPIRK